MKSKLKKSFALLLCLLTVFSLLPTTSFAASQCTIDSESNSGFDYFEYLSSGSQWEDLNTPKHTVVETGDVAYCIQHQL